MRPLRPAPVAPISRAMGVSTGSRSARACGGPRAPRAAPRPQRPHRLGRRARRPRLAGALDLKLLAVLGVAGPVAMDAERLPGGQAQHGADDGDVVSFPGDLQAGHHVLRLLAHIRDPRHRPLDRRVGLGPELEMAATCPVCLRRMRRSSPFHLDRASRGAPPSPNSHSTHVRSLHPCSTEGQRRQPGGQRWGCPRRFCRLSTHDRTWTTMDNDAP